MRISFFLLAGVLIAFGPASTAFAKKPPKYTAAQFESWAACAIDKNSDEIIWMKAINSDQSGLKGASLVGAQSYAAVILVRDCTSQDVRMDNDFFSGVWNAIAAKWAGSIDIRSQPRAIDKWVDCTVDKYQSKGAAYLFARDFSFGGPTLIVEGIDPTKALFDDTPECDPLRSASEPLDYLGAYARLNYLLRVKPRLPDSGASSPIGGNF